MTHPTGDRKAHKRSLIRGSSCLLCSRSARLLLIDSLTKLVRRMSTMSHRIIRSTCTRHIGLGPIITVTISAVRSLYINRISDKTALCVGLPYMQQNKITFLAGMLIRRHSFCSLTCSTIIRKTMNQCSHDAAEHCALFLLGAVGIATLVR